MYASRTLYVKRTCTPGAMLCRRATGDNVRMAFDSESQPRHFLREWRKSKGYSLETVAERVEALGAEPKFRLADNQDRPRTMTHATLSRIERGIHPYNQVLLEILAEVYQTSPASLIMRDPLRDDAPWSLADQVRQLQPAQRAQVAAFIEAITRTA